MAMTRRIEMQAVPVKADDPTSSWLTAGPSSEGYSESFGAIRIIRPMREFTLAELMGFIGWKSWIDDRTAS